MASGTWSAWRARRRAGVRDTFSVEHTEHGCIGTLRVEDLADPTRMFDLRLDGPFRGRGLGVDTGSDARRRAAPHARMSP